jgi:diguanylate cyclase (GGDEF)-like protein
MRIQTVLELPGKLPKPILTILAFLLVLTIGSIDFSAGYNSISIALLYLFPILLITWFEGCILAALISIFSAITWSVADLASGHVYSHVAIPIWNAAMVLGMFSIVAYSFATMKRLLIKEREYAHLDDLTSAANAAYFYEQGQLEIKRSVRYKRPLTLVRLDINDYKRLSRTLGQSAGETILRAVAETMKRTLRSTDIISRLSDDQFALLMPETQTEDAEIAIHKVQKHLSDIVKQNGWPVTFNIGAISCNIPACSVDKLIKMAEDLMPAAKAGGENENRLNHQTVERPAAT